MLFDGVAVNVSFHDHLYGNHVGENGNGRPQIRDRHLCVFLFILRMRWASTRSLSPVTGSSSVLLSISDREGKHF
jgi:hypothetical protein